MWWFPTLSPRSPIATTTTVDATTTTSTTAAATPTITTNATIPPPGALLRDLAPCTIVHASPLLRVAEGLHLK